MRIAIDIKAFKNGATGIARYLAALMDCLQGLDTENEYFLFECGSSGYVPHNPRWRTIRLPSSLTGLAFQQLFLPYQLWKHGIDVLWAPEQTCPILLPRGTRLATTLHDLVFIHYPETCRLRTRVVFSVLVPYAVRRSDALLTDSAFVKNEVLAHFERPGLDRRVRVVPCGAPDWRPPANYISSGRGNFLFFAGNLEPRKNLAHLVHALELLRERGRRLELRLAGPQGWKNTQLLEVIRHSPARDQITHLGYLDEVSLKREYLGCRAFVYPSIYEGFGLPVLEALSLDCLVLASKGTVMEEIAGGAAIYFDPRDPADMARTIEYACRSETRLRQMMQPIRESVLQSYSWTKAARQLLDVLTDRTAVAARVG